MKRAEEQIKEYEEMTMSYLTSRLNKCENRIFAMISQGERHSKSGNLRRLKAERGRMRRVLLNKFKLWKKGELKEEITFADTQNTTKEI